MIGCLWNYAAGPDAKSIQTISMILCQLELAEFSALLGKQLVVVVEGNYIGIPFVLRILISDGLYRLDTRSSEKAKKVSLLPEEPAVNANGFALEFMGGLANQRDSHKQPYRGEQS